MTLDHPLAMLYPPTPTLTFNCFPGLPLPSHDSSHTIGTLHPDESPSCHSGFSFSSVLRLWVFKFPWGISKGTAHKHPQQNSLSSNQYSTTVCQALFIHTQKSIFMKHAFLWETKCTSVCLCANKIVCYKRFRENKAGDEMRGSREECLNMENSMVADG